MATLMPESMSFGAGVRAGVRSRTIAAARILPRNRFRSSFQSVGTTHNASGVLFAYCRGDACKEQSSAASSDRRQVSGFLSFAVCSFQFFNGLFYLPLMLSQFGEVVYSCRDLLVARLVGRAKS